MCSTAHRKVESTSVLSWSKVKGRMPPLYPHLCFTPGFIWKTKKSGWQKFCNKDYTGLSHLQISRAYFDYFGFIRYFVLFCTFACCFVVLGVEAFVGSISLPVHRFSAATGDSTTTRTRCWQFYFSRSRPEICGKCILWIFVVPFQCFQDDYRIS